MSDSLKPRDAADIEDAVNWALAEGKTLELVGHGTKRGIGRAAQWDLTLDVSGLCGVTLYEPEDLVLSAKAGTPLATIEALLAEKGQELAFEPLDYGPLFGKPSGQGTIGGALAANASGPRRIKAGAARDHFLGVTAVSARGETFKSGGRVVKNVTGYDLCKVLAGSWGTLAVMAEVTLKVMPRAETEATLVLSGLNDEMASRAMAAAMGSPCEVSGAAHVPGSLAPHLPEAGVGEGATVFRLEGPAPSIAHRRLMLEALLKPFGRPMAVLGEDASRGLWRAIRDVKPFAAHAGDEGPLWRISTAPARGHEVVARVAASADARSLYDWAGGLIWLSLPPADDAHAKRVRDAVEQVGGHATLVRAPAAVRAAVDVFEPQTGALGLLSARLKDGFDPKRILGPGRMYAGI
jgi:glycolate oxidase FAD binding subunit